MPEIDLDLLLRGVQKPARYSGGEWNAVPDQHGPEALNVALCCLDGYESGMGSRELQWLYVALNETPGIRAERVFLPARDMADRLGSAGVALYAVESKRPVHAFDVVVLLAQRPACLLNAAAMLRLSQIEPFAAEREDAAPLIVAAGEGIVNWEPIAAFVDVALLGDPDESLPAALEAASGGGARDERLARIARVPGVYTPSFYTISDADGTARYIGPGEPPELRRLHCDYQPFAARQVVPHIEIDRDGGLVDLTRCTTAEEAAQAALALGEACGYQQVRLLAPPLRVYDFCAETAACLRRAAPSSDLRLLLPPLDAGFAEAIDAGALDELAAAAETAFRAGWPGLTLAAVLGRPDAPGVNGTAYDGSTVIDAARRVLDVGQRVLGRRPRLRVELTPFTPLAGGPGERLPAIDPEQARETAAKIKKQLRKLGAHTASADADTAVIEAALSRAGRDVAGVLAAEAFPLYDERDGAIDRRAWEAACEGAGFDWTRLLAVPAEGDPLPWAHLGRAAARA